MKEIEYIRYSNISNEKQNEFELAYDKAKEALRKSSHCLNYELSHCVEKPENYILRIEWDSLEGHMKGFRSSPDFQTFYKAVQPFFNNIEEMRHYEITRIRK
jgi:quinol monooxygenase YgiN